MRDLHLLSCIANLDIYIFDLMTRIIILLGNIFYSSQEVIFIFIPSTLIQDLFVQNFVFYILLKDSLTRIDIAILVFGVNFYLSAIIP